jgi:DNA polymerase-3 subunit gamma/tau
MSHIALARKWRPQKFEDVIGQRGVVDTLRNAIGGGRVAHSFIFAGPRGVGKTTTARILARALNCVQGPTADPCGKCDACTEIAEGRDIDVLEIDGATYTGVDAVREVIVEPLSISPMRDRFKIFIIDEVHRLSKNAFDALLKSIEEPPPYVTFMMATTDLHAVPATIQSRSQVFELKALPFGSIREQLKRVTKGEKIQVDDAALALVARSAEGSMRDALSALDQVLAFTADKVTAADVSTVLGLIGRDVQFDIAETVAREDAAAIFELAGSVVDAGFDLRIVCRELARLMRDVMVVGIDPKRLEDPEIASESERPRMKALAGRYSREDLLRAFDLLSASEYQIRQSSQPRHTFEMTLLKWIHLRKLTPLSELMMGQAGASGASAPRSAPPPARPSAPAAPTRVAAPASSSRPSAPIEKPAAVAAAPRAAASEPPREPIKGDTPGPATDLKATLLAAIRENNKLFFGMVVAQAQKIEIDEKTVAFTFAPVHKSLRSQLEAKRSWLEQLSGQLAGRPMKILTLEGAAAPAPEAGSDPNAAAKQAELRARAKAEPVVQAVLDVFGGEIEDVEETT